MRYIIQQKILSFGNDYEVLDENGRKLYYFDSKIGGFRPRIILEDATGSRIGLVKKQLFTFRPVYLFYENSRFVSKIIKKWFSIRKSFFIQTAGGEIIDIKGSFVEHTYTCYKQGRPVAEVAKKWFAGNDTYVVDIGSADNVLSILSAVVVIDIIHHPGRTS